jgi:hypothetical protein
LRDEAIVVTYTSHQQRPLGAAEHSSAAFCPRNVPALGYQDDETARLAGGFLHRGARI